MTAVGFEALRTIADYQFGTGAGTALFPEEESPEIRRTSSGRPRQVAVDGARLVTLKTDGRFSLGLEGGVRIASNLPFPAYRVVVGDESEPFVRDGKNVFAKFVRRVDPDVRASDEVVVEHERNEVIAVGRAELDASAMMDFESGMAVSVREGRPAESETKG
ncbi:MAG: PUA domain-containing protein [Halodesulfurarchaeum sp.]